MTKKTFEVFDVPTFQAQPRPSQSFVINPLVPTPGITLLHGRWGTFKTAVLVTEAVCVSSGQPFLGLATTAGPVLVIEADMGRQLFLSRFYEVIQRIDPKAPIKFILTRPFDCVSPLFRQSELGLEIDKIAEEFKPSLVLVDALRRTHTKDEREGSTSNEVYDYWTSTFPNSAVQIIAHDRKQMGVRGTHTPGEEDFSGHQGWLNDAQSAMHISPTGSADEGTFVIEHTKSQCAQTGTKLDVRKNSSGDWVKLIGAGEVSKRLNDIMIRMKGKQPGEIDREIMREFKIKERWARVRRKEWENAQSHLLAKSLHDQACLEEAERNLNI